MANLESYYDTAFGANAQGNIYRPFTTFERLSHQRRVELLAELPISPLHDSTVVDYGVGAWGIGCVFPRIKEAAILHGIDISDRALSLTRRVCQDDLLLRNKDVRLSRSDGYKLNIESASVDLFFAGEAIEHIDETDAFLEEVYRVMRVGATAIFTTPNAAPFVYRNLGMRWCVGFEHTALMDYKTLCETLSQCFELEIVKGFNQTLHPQLDDTLDEASAAAWVSASEDDPENATGLIFMVRKTDDRRFPPRRIDIVEGTSCDVDGPFHDMDVTSGYLGRMIEPGSTLSIPVPPGARKAALLFWSHDWSGVAQIQAGPSVTEVELFHPIGGSLRQIVNLSTENVLSLRSATTRHPASHASQVIFLRAVFST